MDDVTKTPGGLPGNQGQLGTNGTTESHEPSAGHSGGDTPAPDPAPHGAGSGETNPGPHQVQAGLHS